VAAAKSTAETASTVVGTARASTAVTAASVSVTTPAKTKRAAIPVKTKRAARTRASSQRDATGRATGKRPARGLTAAERDMDSDDEVRVSQIDTTLPFRSARCSNCSEVTQMMGSSRRRLCRAK
jgi:formylmethanofuran dehydrogenase subunit E